MEIGIHLTDKAKRDYELVRAALDKGDQSAYAELMKNYRDTLYFMLLKMTNSSTDAEDLTIEAFSKAFRNLDQYTPQYAFSTWLFKIASNNCIDFMRKQRLNTTSLSGSDPDEQQNISDRFAADGLDPEEETIKQQKIATMRKVVEKLKPHYRTLIELRYFQELSYEEISAELNLPLGTVKAQLFRAREFLAQIMKNLEGKI